MFVGWWRRRSARNKKRLIFYPALVAVAAGFVAFVTAMPGASHHGALAPLDDEQGRLAAGLRRDVTRLTGIGERHLERAGTLDRAWAQLDGELSDAGYVPKSLRYRADERTVANIEATREASGVSREIVVIGAHYDTAAGAPGADDNASGVAVLLALARAFEKRPQRRILRFVAFVNEEPPHFWNETMGSLHYARDCKARGDEIVAMLSLESLGYYRDAPGSQKYPPILSWLYPDRGDFVAFVGDLGSRGLVRQTIGTFRRAAQFPSEGAAAPGFVPGVGWSDQWSFWKQGYPGVMVTDTAPFRNPNYHTARDVADTLDYDRLARVTAGLIAVVGELSR